MVARTLYVIDSDALTVTYSTRQQVGDRIINNSDSPNGTQYLFGAGYTPQQVIIEDTGGSADRMEDDRYSQHKVTDGAGLVANGTGVEAESIIQVQAVDAGGAPTGPVINLYVLSKGNVTGDIWGFASDSLLSPGTTYLKVGGNNIGTLDYANYQTPWDVVVDGTDGDDVMEVGHSDAEGDQIDGLDGNNEIIQGYGGNDLIHGGIGHDSIYGGTGADTLDGGAGGDILDGGAGRDTADYSGSDAGVQINLDTGQGSGGTAQGDSLSEIENLTGSRFADSLVGDGTDNLLDGGAGADTLQGGAGADTLFGRTGDDLLSGGDQDDNLFGNEGSDTLFGGAGNDRLEGGLSADSLSGDAGNDNIFGDEGADTLLGGLGDDTLQGGADGDSLSGGEGNDNIFGDDGADTLEGGGGADLLVGGADNDSLSGDGENDSLYGNEGADTLLGGAGADLLEGGLDNDSLSGGDGNDSLYGNEGTDTLDGGVGADLLEGGLDNDSLSGGDGNDSLYGNEGADTLDGGAGADLLEGGLDNDSLSGGADNDSLYGNEGADTLDGGAGADLLVGGADNDSLSGGADSDSLYGNEGADTLEGGTGADLLVGGADNDSLSGGDDDDALFGNEGADTLDGGAGNDLLEGGLENDGLSGGAGNDTLSGGAGADTLDGGAGQDLLIGGEGADQFIIEKADYSALGTDEAVTAALLRENLSDLTGWAAKKAGVLPPQAGGPGNETPFPASALDISAVGDAVRDAAPPYLPSLSVEAIVGLVETSLTGIVAADPDAPLEANVIGQLVSDLVAPTFGANATGRTANAVVQDINRQKQEFAEQTSPPEITEAELLALAKQVTIEDFEIGTDVLVLSSHDYLGGLGLSTNDVKVTDTVGDGTGDAILNLPDGSTVTLIGIDPRTLDPETLETMGFLPSNDTSDFQNAFVTAGGKIFGGGGDDELVGSLNAELFSGGTGNDKVFGGAGADTIFGGSGSDLIEGGEGDDVLYTGTGDDTLLGGEGNDILYNSSGDDSLSGGAGDDKLVASSGDDTLEGDEGADTLIGGIDDDRLLGGEGNDLLLGDFEARGLVEAQQLFAYEYYELDGAASLTSLADAGFTSGTENDRAPDGEGVVQSIDPLALDSFHGGNGDTFAVKLATTLTVTNAGSYSFDLTSDDGAQLWIDGVLLADNDGVHGQQSVSGSTSLSQGEHLIEILYFDQSGTEKLSVNMTGPDTGGHPIDLAKADLSTSFDDHLVGGQGDDTLSGGLGDDTFVYSAGDGSDVIRDFNLGNTGTLSDGDATNNDFIDLSGFYDHLSELYADQEDDGILNQSNDGVRGVDYSDNSQFGTGSLTFTGARSNSSFYTTENTGVVCFAAGTTIRTPRGEVPIEELQVGDLVCTLDHGPQPLRWIGRREVGREELAADPRLRPVLIPRGLFGASRDLLVSRQHALLIDADHLARALHLAEARGLPARIAHGKRQVTYIHLMFDAHQIIFGNGVASESFYPGTSALEMLAPAARATMMAAFPALAAAEGPAQVAPLYGPTARPILDRAACAEIDFKRRETRQPVAKGGVQAAARRAA